MTDRTRNETMRVGKLLPDPSAERNSTTTTTPVVVGYVSAVSDEDRRQQHEVLAVHAASAGMRLMHVVEDPHGSVTLGELVEVADHYGAVQMLLPEGAPLAARYRSLTSVLARIDAVCAVVPAASSSTAEWLCA